MAKVTTTNGRSDFRGKITTRNFSPVDFTSREVKSTGEKFRVVIFPRKSLRPFVVVTFAMTVDGKITTRNFSPVDFTSREHKMHLFLQDSLVDGVLNIHHTD